MTLNPFTVLTDAIKAMPSLKYGLGVAGVIAAGMVAVGLANDRPQFAVLTFVFVLAGMFLLAIFVGAAGKMTGGMLKGPLLVIVWVLTLVFAGLILAFFTGFLFGWPDRIAALLDVPPASMRLADSAGARRDVAVVIMPAPASAAMAASAAASAAMPPAVVAVSMPVTFSDRDDNCDANRLVPVQWCLPQGGARLKNWSGPSIQSANCGSQFENIRKVGDNCLAADARIKGCGYDNLVFAKNCKGSGWLSGTFQLEGEAPSM